MEHPRLPPLSHCGDTFSPEGSLPLPLTQTKAAARGAQGRQAQNSPWQRDEAAEGVMAVVGEIIENTLNSSAAAETEAGEQRETAFEVLRAANGEKGFPVPGKLSILDRRSMDGQGLRMPLGVHSAGSTSNRRAQRKESLFKQKMRSLRETQLPEGRGGNAAGGRSGLTKVSKQRTEPGPTAGEGLGFHRAAPGLLAWKEADRRELGADLPPTVLAEIDRESSGLLEKMSERERSSATSHLRQLLGDDLIKRLTQGRAADSRSEELGQVAEGAEQLSRKEGIQAVSWQDVRTEEDLIELGKEVLPRGEQEKLCWMQAEQMAVSENVGENSRSRKAPRKLLSASWESVRFHLDGSIDLSVSVKPSGGGGQGSQTDLHSRFGEGVKKVDFEFHDAYTVEEYLLLCQSTVLAHQLAGFKALVAILMARHKALHDLYSTRQKRFELFLVPKQLLFVCRKGIDHSNAEVVTQALSLLVALLYPFEVLDECDELAKQVPLLGTSNTTLFGFLVKAQGSPLTQVREVDEHPIRSLGDIDLQHPELDVHEESLLSIFLSTGLFQRFAYLLEREQNVFVSTGTDQHTGLDRPGWQQLLSLILQVCTVFVIHSEEARDRLLSMDRFTSVLFSLLSRLSFSSDTGHVHGEVHRAASRFLRYLVQTTSVQRVSATMAQQELWRNLWSRGGADSLCEECVIESLLLQRFFADSPAPGELAGGLPMSVERSLRELLLRGSEAVVGHATVVAVVLGLFEEPVLQALQASHRSAAVYYLAGYLKRLDSDRSSSEQKLAFQEPVWKAAQHMVEKTVNEVLRLLGELGETFSNSNSNSGAGHFSVAALDNAVSIHHELALLSALSNHFQSEEVRRVLGDYAALTETVSHVLLQKLKPGVPLNIQLPPATLLGYRSLLSAGTLLLDIASTQGAHPTDLLMELRISQFTINCQFFSNGEEDYLSSAIHKFFTLTHRLEAAAGESGKEGSSDRLSHWFRALFQTLQQTARRKANAGSSAKKSFVGRGSDKDLLSALAKCKTAWLLFPLLMSEPPLPREQTEKVVAGSLSLGLSLVQLELVKPAAFFVVVCYFVFDASNPWKEGTDSNVAERWSQQLCHSLEQLLGKKGHSDLSVDAIVMAFGSKYTAHKVLSQLLSALSSSPAFRDLACMILLFFTLLPLKQGSNSSLRLLIWEEIYSTEELKIFLACGLGDIELENKTLLAEPEHNRQIISSMVHCYGQLTHLSQTSIGGRPFFAFFHRVVTAKLVAFFHPTPLGSTGRQPNKRSWATEQLMGDLVAKSFEASYADVLDVAEPMMRASLLRVAEGNKQVFEKLQRFNADILQAQ